MGKEAGLKEEISTLRTLIGFMLGLVVVVVSGLISRYDAGKTDFVFYIGLVGFAGFIFSATILYRKLIKKTKELEEL